VRRALSVLLALFSLSFVGGQAVAAPRSASPRAAIAPGLARLLAAGPARAVTSGIAVLPGRAAPSRGQVAALRAVGLRVQSYKRLPLAIVRGTRDQLAAAVRRGTARDIYPNERLEYFSVDSRHQTRVDRIPGITGKGVTVAIVDSGIDGTHPDLAHRVKRNYKLLGPEYANLPPDAGIGTVAVPFSDTPVNDSDLGSGHGTHVAGIIAADGTTTPAIKGMAPGADLIGLSIGEVLFTTAVISGFDEILAHPEWGVDVVNNSWGSSHQTYDPNHPINIASRALYKAGVVVVFAAGNDGTDHTQMTMNPFSIPPWVISVAAGTVDDPTTHVDEGKQRASFSSVGQEYDNSEPVPIPADGHERFTGDRVGVYHPDVTAPGENIVSAGTPLGAAVTPDPTSPREAVASGTSMASPHVAGAAALLLQANPKLKPDQVRQALQVTATKLADNSPFREAGYGYIDVAASVALVRRADFGQPLLDRLQSAADARVLAETPLGVQSGDYWTWPAAPVSFQGIPDFQTLSVRVSSKTRRIQAWCAYPSAATVGANIGEYLMTVRDAAGRVLAESTSSFAAGTASLTIDRGALRGARFGTWTIEVSGLLSVSDPDTLDNDSILGRTVSVAFLQLT
jgi:serine protease AprX